MDYWKAMSLEKRSNPVISEADDESAIKRSLILAAHQTVATVGVLLWTMVLTNSFLEIPRIWGHVYPSRDISRMLLATPYFPIQIIVGLLCGWLVWMRFQHRAMLWVWVFPLIALVFGLLQESARTYSMLDPSIMSRFFGSGCRIEDHCFAQIGMVLPFYTGVSYSLGAWLALRFPVRSRHVRRVVFSAVIVIGIFILADTIVGLVLNFGRTWWWAVLLAGTFEAIMGAYLILFARRMLRSQTQPPRCSRFSEQQ